MSTMTKYVISSRKSVLKSIERTGDHTTIILTNKDEGMLIDTIKEAMETANIVNKLVGLPVFMIMPIEITVNKN